MYSTTELSFLETERILFAFKLIARQHLQTLPLHVCDFEVFAPLSRVVKIAIYRKLILSKKESFSNLTKEASIPFL